MTDLVRVPCLADDESDEKGVYVVVETPRGTSAKLKYDTKHRVIRFERALALGVAYPYDWGFIPSTIAEDGDPLDAMVMFRTPMWPGVIVPSRPIGIVEIEQTDKEAKNQRNDRVISVPMGDPRQHVDEISDRRRRELEQFFITVGSMTHKKVEIIGWRGPKAAWRAITEAHERFKETSR